MNIIEEHAPNCIQPQEYHDKKFPPLRLHQSSSLEEANPVSILGGLRCTQDRFRPVVLDQQNDKDSLSNTRLNLAHPGSQISPSRYPSRLTARSRLLLLRQCQLARIPALECRVLLGQLSVLHLRSAGLSVPGSAKREQRDSSRTLSIWTSFTIIR
jgi:hypothetical protein